MNEQFDPGHAETVSGFRFPIPRGDVPGSLPGRKHRPPATADRNAKRRSWPGHYSATRWPATLITPAMDPLGHNDWSLNPWALKMGLLSMHVLLWLTDEME